MYEAEEKERETERQKEKKNGRHTTHTLREPADDCQWTRQAAGVGRRVGETRRDLSGAQSESRLSRLTLVLVSVIHVATARVSSFVYFMSFWSRLCFSDTT
jgi:hypothetical protein